MLEDVDCRARNSFASGEETRERRGWGHVSELLAFIIELGRGLGRWVVPFENGRDQGDINIVGIVDILPVFRLMPDEGKLRRDWAYHGRGGPMVQVQRVSKVFAQTLCISQDNPSDKLCSSLLVQEL